MFSGFQLFKPRHCLQCIVTFFLICLGPLAQAQSDTPAVADSPSGIAEKIIESAKPAQIPVLITYRSSSLASRLALDGARLRLASEPQLNATELDLDGQGGALPDVRRKLTDTSTKILIALEPSLDPSLPPIVDSLGIAVVASSFLEGVISPSTRGLFSVYPRMNGVRDAVERFFITQPQIKNFTIICSNARLGLKYSEIWNEIGAKRGVKIPPPACGNEQSFDFRVALIRVKGQQMDGLGVGFGIPNVIARLHDMSWPRPLLLTASQGEQLISNAIDHSALPDIFFDSPVYSELFSNAFSQRYEGRAPTISNALGYEAVTSVAKALAINSDAVQGMLKLTYNGVSGPMDFTVENTGNSAKSVLMRIEGKGAIRIN